MQQVSLRVNEHYGDEIIHLALPERWKIHTVEMACKETPQLNDNEIRTALDTAVGVSNIEEQARGKTVELSLHVMTSHAPRPRTESSLS